MFFSPCLEVEAYFLAAGVDSFRWTVLLSGIYFFVTLLGMLIWVTIAYHGLNKFNWHALEHKTGIIAGVTLITSGIVSFFLS
jgi:cytosine/uracil/thiamine/allantoin permease